MRIEKNEWIAQSFVAFSVLNQKENNNGNLVLCQHLTNCVSRFFFELYKTYLIYFCKQLCCNLGKGDNETLLPTQINSQTGNFQWCFPFQWNRFCYMTVFRLMIVQQLCVCVCADKKEIRRDFDFHLFTSSWWSRPLFLDADQEFKCIFGCF